MEEKQLEAIRDKITLLEKKRVHCKKTKEYREMNLITAELKGILTVVYLLKLNLY